jgi:light-regulated signal transduction histidine kinase (bacteriophytochrome)
MFTLFKKEPVKDALKQTQGHHLLRNPDAVLGNEQMQFIGDLATFKEAVKRFESNQHSSAGALAWFAAAVLKNIISNALKYSKRDIKPVIDIKYKRQQKFHIISIQDNGIGIDEKYHQRIFEIFQRLHTRDEYPGSGIGLALSRKIMQKLGGEIFVTSEFGKGSIFFLKLPTEEKVI